MNNFRINHAIQFATTAHGNQMRKGATPVPYIFHPLDVANEVLFYSGLEGKELEKAVILGILHDTVEDTIATLDDIEEQFGREIRDGVSALTKDETLPREEQMPENLVRLKAAPRFVQAPKLADRTSNLKSFPAMWDREKIAAYLDEGLLIANVLGDASETQCARLLMRIADTRNQLSLYSSYTH